MHKYKELLPSILILAFIGKQLILGTSPAEMGVTCVLGALYGLQTYLEKSRKANEIAAIVDKQNEVIEKMAKEIVALRDSVGSMKLAGGIHGMRKTGT